MTQELRLSLKRQWFEMTDAGIKTEDYREINEYWCTRFFDIPNSKVTPLQASRVINNFEYYGFKAVTKLINYYHMDFKPFTINTMTLGYPRKDDKSRIIQFEHKGIEIRTGNPDWGAIPNKLYFVILHGARITP